MLRLMTFTRRCPSIFPYGYFCSHIDRSSLAPLLLTFFLIEAPLIPLIYHLFHHSLLPYVFPSLLLLLDISAIASMLLCSFTDPGIIPQNVNNYEWQTELHELPPLNHSMKSEHSYVFRNGYGLTSNYKYCVECHLYRPLRTIHCRECNHCVERYDHHCPWLGLCIGKYNYKFFIVFLTLLNIVVLTATGCCLAVVIMQAKDKKPVTDYLI